MRALRWVLLVAVGLVLGAPEAEKDMSPVEWIGGETILDPKTGEKCYNGLATRAQIHEHFAFVTIPRLKPDVKSTLCKLDMTKKLEGETKHILVPFPPGKPPPLESCEGLQSAVDVFLDHFDVIWCLDVGAVYPPKPLPDGRMPSQPRICPPKVIAYDTSSGKILHQINLMPHVVQMSRLQFVIVDYSAAGRPFIYVTDAGSKSLIVWDVDADKGTRIPLPEKVLNEYSPRDVFYALLIRKSSGNNKIFFSYRSGESMWCIETKNLQKDKSMDKAFEVGKKANKMIFLGTDDWDCMYFRYEKQPDVYKWNTETEFDEKNFQLVHKSDSGLIPTHAIADYKNGVMRLVESNLVEYLKPEFPAKDSVNSLSVMAVNGQS